MKPESMKIGGGQCGGGVGLSQQRKVRFTVMDAVICWIRVLFPAVAASLWAGAFPRVLQPTSHGRHSVHILTTYTGEQGTATFRFVSPRPGMAPSAQSLSRSHSLLLLQKLLNLRDNASPFTLALDTVEQSAAPLVREFMGRARVGPIRPFHPPCR